jgi:hypothetical protein
MVKNILKILSLLASLVMTKGAYSSELPTVYVASIKGAHLDTFNYTPTTTAGQLYQEISIATGIPLSSLKLMCQGKLILNNNTPFTQTETVSAYGGTITNLSTTINSYASAYNNLNQSIVDKDITGTTNALESLKALNPDAATALFKNGGALDYKTLNTAGFTDTQIVQIAQTGGVARADLNAYFNSHYTGASDVPPIVPGGDPTNPIDTGTGNQTGNIPAAQEEFYQLKTVTAENLQLLITQNELTKTEFNDLVTNQENTLNNLKEAGTASEEEIAEMENELAISKSVLANGDTNFAPEKPVTPVEPVVDPVL